MLGLMTKDFIITFFTWGHFNRGLFVLGILWLLHYNFFTLGLFRFGLFPSSPFFILSSFLSFDHWVTENENGWVNFFSSEPDSAFSDRISAVEKYLVLLFKASVTYGLWKWGPLSSCCCLSRTFSLSLSLSLSCTHTHAHTPLTLTCLFYLTDFIIITKIIIYKYK